MTPTEIKKKTTELKKQYYKENLVENGSKSKTDKQKITSSDMEYLQNKLDSFNSKQRINFIFNYSILEDETRTEEEQNKAYDNLIKLFYGKGRN